MGMAAIGTAVDVEPRAELAAEARRAGRRRRATRSFFMDVYAEMTRRLHERARARPPSSSRRSSVKNQHNGALNPRAQYGGEISVEDVLASRG